jgi:hypothetical protein
MLDITVLVMAGDPRWIERLWSGLRELAGCRVVVADTSEEARDLLECVAPSMMIVNGEPGIVTDEQIDELLWANSRLARPATVVVVADSYDPKRALGLYRIGIDEYLGGEEHWGRLARILGHWLPIACSRQSTHRVLPVAEPARPVRQVPAAPLRWVSAEPA